MDNSAAATSYFVVDAFTDKPFGGNPAAVCLLNCKKNDEWLQQVAAEFNLSETAFVSPEVDNRWDLRWFTPACEVNLCGHATLAAAHVLARELHLPYDEFLFSTLSGVLSAEIQSKTIALNFPKIEPKLFNKIYLHDQAMDFANLNLNVVAAYQAGEDIILELVDESEVLNYIPRLDELAAINARGIIITSKSNSAERDFVSRFFAPRVGINEDPVTGSAHCSLAVLWSKKLGKSSLRAEQLSARRGSLQINVYSDYVNLIGESVTFSRGTF